jgi:iron complex transport system substrate-binding protein
VQHVTSIERKRIPITYAKGFTIEDFGAYKKLIVRDPLDSTKIIESYYLIHAGDSVPVTESIAQNNIITIPIQSIACLSTTHLGFLERLNLQDKIIAASGTQYVYDSLLNNLIANGKVKEMGFESALNYEMLVQIHPDIIMTYVFGADGEEAMKKLSSLKLQSVVNNEYLELTPLGQAEWIKYVAAFFDLSDEADSIFKQIETEYLRTKSLALKTASRPKVLTSLPFRGEWTVSGGKSFAANYLADAGADYLWKDNESTGNFPVSMEQILVKGMDADCWINIGPVDSKTEIKNADAKLVKIKAYQSGNLFNNDKRMSAQGGNDYWESGVVNPQYVLQDLVKIFHPEIMEQHTFYYYKKIE